jgi:CDP-4-dehydro-6-deoxyglucose reductase, E1
MYNWPLMPNIITWGDKWHMTKFLWRSDRLTNGPQVREFEQAWNTWLGSSHSLMVSSGSTANFLMLASVMELYGIPKGAKVLLPACTWVTNVAPVIQLGLTPIFCDVNLNNFSFDPDHLKLIAHTHPDIQIIFVTHLLGYTAPTSTLSELWPHAHILDDVCESHGCTHVTGHKVGSRSLAASFSFYFGHHMTTIEGGMVSTHDAQLYDLMRMKRSHGLARESTQAAVHATQHPHINPQFLFMTDGYNFRSTELNAVLGLRQLRRLDAMISTRRELFDKFSQLINSHQDVLYACAAPTTSSPYCVPLICRNEATHARLVRALTENAVEHRPIVGGNLLRQPFLKSYTWGAPLPQSAAHVDVLNDQGVYVGLNHIMHDHHVHVLAEILSQL